MKKEFDCAEMNRQIQAEHRREAQELDAFLQSRVKSGRYQTTSEVVREALRLLERQEQEREAGLRQLKAKLKRGAAQAERDALADGAAVFEDLRQLIQERRQAGKKAHRS